MSEAVSPNARPRLLVLTSDALFPHFFPAHVLARLEEVGEWEHFKGREDSKELRERLARADVILFDGTLFTDDEMIASGTGSKTGRRMGHLPINGADGSLSALDGVGKRRIYIHINNTNPILIDGSAERRRVEGAGWEVAADGLEISL